MNEFLFVNCIKNKMPSRRRKHREGDTENPKKHITRGSLPFYISRFSPERQGKYGNLCKMRL